jgi:hypothetical protein
MPGVLHRSCAALWAKMTEPFSGKAQEERNTSGPSGYKAKWYNFAWESHAQVYKSDPVVELNRPSALWL